MTSRGKAATSPGELPVVIYYTPQRGNWDPLYFNSFIVSSRAQPECAAAVSPLLLWGIPRNRRPHRRGKQTPTFGCLSINIGTKYTKESLKGFPICRSYIGAESLGVPFIHRPASQSEPLLLQGVHRQGDRNAHPPKCPRK